MTPGLGDDETPYPGWRETGAGYCVGIPLRSEGSTATARKIRLRVLFTM